MSGGAFRRRTLAGLIVAAVVFGVGSGGRPGYASPEAAYQQRLDSAVQKMLDAVVGVGRADVTTAVELDRGQVESVSTTYTRDPGVGALTEKLSRESYTAADGSVRSETSRSARASALNVLRETRRTAPGGIKRLSVAVVVDSAAGADLTRLRRLVAAAAGVDPGRGDVVAVSAMPFAPVATTAAVPAAPVSDPRPLLVAVGLAVLLIGLVVARRSRRGPPSPPPGPRPPLPAVRVGAEPAASPVRGEAAGAVAGAPGGGPDRRRMIGQFAADDPARATDVLRGWTGRS